jgi:hypothetical protein
VEPGALRLPRDGAQVVRFVADGEEDAELQADELSPGQPVVLVPQRGRDGRVEGVRVFDEAIDHLAGWLLADLAGRIDADEVRRGEVRARSLYEWRDDAGRRLELAVLIHRSDAVVPE